MSDVVHIHAPPGFAFRKIMQRKCCGTRGRVYGRLYEWYGPEVWCCSCGLAAYRKHRRKPDARKAAWAKAQWATAPTYNEALKTLIQRVDGLVNDRKARSAAEEKQP